MTLGIVPLDLTLIGFIRKYILVLAILQRFASRLDSETRDSRCRVSPESRATREVTLHFGMSAGNRPEVGVGETENCTPEHRSRARLLRFCEVFTARISKQRGVSYHQKNGTKSHLLRRRRDAMA